MPLGGSGAHSGSSFTVGPQNVHLASLSQGRATFQETQSVGGRISEAAQLLTALQFAARKHRAQRRKDVGGSPYINHPIEVATILATRGGVTDLATLMAAILHDTIEDTDTTPEELGAVFGTEVRDLVLELTDDKRLPKADRKRLQIEHASRSSSKAKLVKLGDKIANVRDVAATPPAGWTLDRRRDYLDWTARVVAGCRGANAELERYYDEVLALAQAALER
jgi:guanosine-3',5'-bis(diphosphate) 3'-pyrophosphohydrolase